MPGKQKILVFPCGSENASEIFQALRYSVHVDLLGASSVEDFGRFRFDQYIGGLPNIQSPDFHTAFAQLIAEHSVDIVFATHDTVQEYLSGRASAMRFHLVNGDPAASRLARRKGDTYRLFEDCAWAPKVYETIDDVVDWPVVVKPDRGQGGVGVSIVSDRPAALSVLRDMADPIVVEHLPGDEITVDCFTDRHRRLVVIGPRTRDRVRAGIAMRSRHIDVTPDLRDIATTINQRLQLRGPWFFQVKRDVSLRWKLLELSCRVGGAMVTQRARGINLPLLAVLDILQLDVSALPIVEVDLVERSIATRSSLRFEYDIVVIDFDDTIVVNGKVNPVAMAFLYQALGDGKRVKLLTRHASDVLTTLKRARIASTLFDEIVQIGPAESKADHVPATAIFIDNHFPERREVLSRCKVPVFDVDAIEFLIR